MKNLTDTFGKKYNRTITCHFCFKIFEVDFQINSTFYGQISEIYDCSICCNPNKIDYEVWEGQIENLQVSDGNE